MHKTLSRAANRRLIVVWVAGVCTLTLAGSGRGLPSLVVGATVGVLAGFAQEAALKSSPQAFATTTTAFEVRRAMVTSRAGRLSIWMTRVCATGLLFFVWRAWQAHEFELMLVHWLGGFFAFMLVRDLIAFRGLRAIELLAGQPSSEAG